jgi:hypothetical protein
MVDGAVDHSAYIHLPRLSTFDMIIAYLYLQSAYRASLSIFWKICQKIRNHLRYARYLNQPNDYKIIYHLIILDSYCGR